MKAVLFSVLSLLVNLGSVPGTYIYESINWVPQNPIFKADGSQCSTGHRHLKVELQSTAIFICPNTATVLQKSSVGIQPANMFENLWLLYNKTAFDRCDASLDPNRRRLLLCETPGKLKFSSVQFALVTAEQDGLTFKAGQSYYFIATSDGTESNLNSTRGGHCNDTVNKIYMKLEVYVCHSNMTYTEEKCQSGIGEVKCPAATQAPTTPSHTTVTAPSTQPHTTAQSVPSQTTETSLSTKYTKSWTEEGPETVTTPTPTITTTDEGNNTTGKKQALHGGDVGLLTKEVNMWKTIAIIVMICCFLVIVALFMYWQNCFGMNKASNCPVKGKISNYGSKTLSHKPLETQASVIGNSNHGFVIDRDSIMYGDEKRVPNGNISLVSLPNRCSVYENVDGSQPTLTSTECHAEDVLEKDPGVIIQSEDVFFDNNREKEKGNGGSPV